MKDENKNILNKISELQQDIAEIKQQNQTVAEEQELLKDASMPQAKNINIKEINEIEHEPIPLWERTFRLVFIFIGALVYTFGLELFLIPNHTIDGGVTGISLMLSTLTGLPFGLFFVGINLPFLYLGYKHIGKSFTYHTLWGVVSVAGCTSLMHYAQPATSDPFLGAVFGGITLGIGVGIIIRSNGSLDGTEIVAIILDKKISFSVGEIIMIFNLFILGTAGFVYNWNSAMYSLIVYFIAYRMMDVIIKGLDESKGVMIVTNYPDEVSQALMSRLGRGVTVLYGEGGYLKEKKRILYSVISRLEMTKIKDVVYDEDPSAFVTITDVYDVFGGQFKKKSIH